VLAVVLAVVVLVGLAPAAGARPRLERVAGHLVGDLWKTVLELPADDTNPLVNPQCKTVDQVVVPFAPLGPDVPPLRCDVRLGVPLFVAGRTWEQSAWEQVNQAHDPDTSEAALRAEALRLLDQQGPPQVRFDGHRLKLVKAVSGLVRVDLPDNNLFGDPTADSTTLVGAGWVTLVVPPPGRHTITIRQPDGTGTTTYLRVGRRAH
jgi:hypothetical protein